MLSNAYFLAKFRFDTAENEPAKNLQNFVNFPNFANPNPQPLSRKSRSPWSASADSELRQLQGRSFSAGGGEVRRRHHDELGRRREVHYFVSLVLFMYFY